MFCSTSSASFGERDHHRRRPAHGANLLRAIPPSTLHHAGAIQTLDTIEDAIATSAKVVIVVDDEDRENEETSCRCAVSHTGNDQLHGGRGPD